MPVTQDAESVEKLCTPDEHQISNNIEKSKPAELAAGDKTEREIPPAVSEKEIPGEAVDQSAGATKSRSVRNPITGEGCPEASVQKANSRRPDGNPVLGTGYDYNVKTQKVNTMPIGGRLTFHIT